MFDQTSKMFDQTLEMFDQTLEMFDQTSEMFDQTLEMFDQTGTKSVWKTGQTCLTRPDKHWYHLRPSRLPIGESASMPSGTNPLE